MIRSFDLWILHVNAGTCCIDFYEWLCKAPACTTYRVNLLQSNVQTVKTQIEYEILKRYKCLPPIYTIPEIPELICVSSLRSVENRIVVPREELNEIIVDTSCGAALLRGAHLYAPGVIAMKSGSKLDEEVNVYADIEGKCKKGTNAVYNSELKAFLGIGIVKMQRYQLFGENIDPKGIAVEMQHTLSGVPSIGDLTSTNALLQNFPSIVCCRVLDPQPGDTVLDMCSAPGNKTTHLAELMKDQGIIIAIDKTESKIKFVKDKVAERKMKSIKCFAFDSTRALSADTASTEITEGPPFCRESFDRILLDAPCSALGNRPLLNCNLSQKMLQSYPAVQKKLFNAAVGLLKPKGTLVYSTCTVTESENEGIVKWALDKYPELRLMNADPTFGSPGMEQSGLSDKQRKQVQRFGPESSQTNFDSVGFFIAKFCKV